MSSPILRFVIPALIVFLFLSLIAIRWVRGRWRKGLRAAQVVTGVYLLMLLLAYAVPVYGIALYDRFRPIPKSETRPLFQGITYTRDVRSSPRPMVIHLVTIDLDAPGIRFLVTPPDTSGGLELRAQTVSHFLQSSGVALAINGDYFDPWWDNSIADYYPLAGQPVNVFGLAASGGRAYSEPREHQSTLFISAANHVTFDERAEPLDNAVSGNGVIVVDGQPAHKAEPSAYNEDLHPRTAVGLDQAGRTLLLLVIDGRQPGYSEGASIAEVASLLIHYGAWTSLNLDGGGSSDLVMAGDDGLPQVLSAPIHNHIPGRERPVANHLGVFARPLTGPSKP